MISVTTLLQALTRAEVNEVCLTSGQRPSARLGERAEELGEEALSGDDLLQILFATGGSRYIDSLGPSPSQWRTRVEGVGAVMVSAAMTGDVIEARFSLRDALTVPAPAPSPVRVGLRPNRTRASDPAAKRTKTGRSVRPPAHDPRATSPQGRRPIEEPVTEPALDDEGDRRSSMPTPPRGFRVPREAMRSVLELDLEIPPVPGDGLTEPFHDGDAIRDLRVKPRAPAETDPGPRAPAEPSRAPAALTKTAPALRVAPQPPPKAAPPPPPKAAPPPPPKAAPPPLPQRSVTPPVPPKAQPPPLPPRSATPPPRPAAAPLANLAALPPPAPPPAPMVVTLPGDEIPTSLPEAPGPSADRRSRAPGHDGGSAPRPPGRTTQPFARESHTPVLRFLLRTAREYDASDLHLVAGRPAMVRVVGQILPLGDAPLDPGLVEDMWLSRVPRRLDEIFERDGSCDFSIEEPELGRFRVNVSRYRGGVKASLRLVPLQVPTLETLGLPVAIAGATRHHQGLIVLTGPMGHGKTTTLAAVVDILNTETTRHVITVEDPLEYIHPRKRALMSQREVGTHTRSFATALKAALREDPDAIVVGELRDTETVRIALEASETGHLVLGTMSTPSAAKAIDRLIDLFPPGEQQQVRMTLAGGLRLIVSQRLLPDAEGKAMVAAAEVLPGVVQLWNMIRDNRTYQIPSFQQRGRELGVIRLDDSLRELVRSGKTTAAAAVAVAEAPDELEQSLGLRRPTPPPMAAVPQPSPGTPGSVWAAAPARPDIKSPEPPAPRGIFDRVFKKGG